MAQASVLLHGFKAEHTAWPEAGSKWHTAWPEASSKWHMTQSGRKSEGSNDTDTKPNLIPQRESKKKIKRMSTKKLSQKNAISFKLDTRIKGSSDSLNRKMTKCWEYNTRDYSFVLLI